MEEEIKALLLCCEYVEDLAAIKHFVFHPRMNGCSNVCLLCKVGCSGEPLWDEGHRPGCSYAQAVHRIRSRGGETLAEYQARS